MESSSEQPNKTDESPLLVMDQSPLDVLLDRLNMSQKDFCIALGFRDSSSYRYWRSGRAFRLTHVQAQRLDSLMRQAGLQGIQDLPEDLRPYKPESA